MVSLLPGGLRVPPGQAACGEGGRQAGRRAGGQAGRGKRELGEGHMQQGRHREDRRGASSQDTGHNNIEIKVNATSHDVFPGNAGYSMERPVSCFTQACGHGSVGIRWWLVQCRWRCRWSQ